MRWLNNSIKKCNLIFNGKLSVSMTMASIALILGTLPLLFIPRILMLSELLFASLFVSVLIIFFIFGKSCKFLALIIMFFLWANWHGINIINHINYLSKKNNDIDVVIVGIPLSSKEQKIKVRIDKINNRIVFPPLYATWKTKETVCAGQSWRINGKIKPLHSSLNEGGFNLQRYYLANRVIGGVKSQKIEPLEMACSVRQKIIYNYMELISSLSNKGIIYGLMFGDRNLLPTDQTYLLQKTGLTHLMAISGLHIGLAYLFGFLIARGIQYFLPIKYISEILPVVIGMVLAIFYAWISGFAIPATRALFALLLWVYIRNKPARHFAWQWALWSIAGILLFDPLAILSDSFWLSSFAVLAILYWLSIFPLAYHLARGIKGKIIGLAHLQIGLLILLIPMQLIIFNGINIMGLAANIWFVPLISWCVVPAILIVFLVPIEVVQRSFLYVIDRVIDLGLKPLPYFSTFWSEFINVPYYLFLICWLSIIVILFKWYKRYFGLIGCVVISIFLERGSGKQLKEGWKMTVLDIGHGLAVVIEQNDLAFLYDTGNTWKEGSNAQRQIVPFLKYHDITPIGLILSHNHLDHTGGVNYLIQQYPWLSVRSSFGPQDTLAYKKKSNNINNIKKMKHLPYFKGQKWQWGILTFEVLWPEKLAPISHNDDSCVIQLTDGFHKILLTGDIEKQGEKSLVAMYKNRLRSNLLFAPHHGSSTSSTDLLLRNVQPSMVVVSSARYSAWKIPSPKVYFRYKNSNIKWLNTAEDGQLTIWFKRGNVQASRYRYEIQPRWYHLWFGLPLFPE
ncbi:DNA internalization-related competence protein ComEC/Rec2 [Providencia rettgeri]|nr:DNA internalization-related competence protein ComEC/Rec2 [Providencia rettgeri]